LAITVSTWASSIVRGAPERGASSRPSNRCHGTHKTPSIKPWFARHPRSHVHFTPTSASWLNQVERWFPTLTKRYIGRGTHRFTRQLEEAIKHYVKVKNEHPKPFVWSKTANDILASVERFALRTSNSRH
jgi:hypothetical protein